MNGHSIERARLLLEREAAILARISPFREHGLYGVSSVISPFTLPYM